MVLWRMLDTDQVGTSHKF